MKEYYADSLVTILHGDCREFDGTADVILTDPPYGLEFMGKEWDKLWRAPDRRQGDYTGSDAVRRTKVSPISQNIATPCYRAGVGAYSWHLAWASHMLGKAGWLFAFGGTRTWHRLACAIEDSGWQIRDTMMWVHSQGFPKGKNCLKPAWEPIIVARKYGDIDIEAGRIPTDSRPLRIKTGEHWKGSNIACAGSRAVGETPLGRWPANLLLDEEAAAMLDEQSGELVSGALDRSRITAPNKKYGTAPLKRVGTYGGNAGGASRFFYVAKASRSERGDGNDHPTVKPLKLMEYLVKLSGGQTILDPFMGSGTTLVAAKRLGRKAIGIDIDEHSCEIAAKRCGAVLV